MRGNLAVFRAPRGVGRGAAVVSLALGLSLLLGCLSAEPGAASRPARSDASSPDVVIVTLRDGVGQKVGTVTVAPSGPGVSFDVSLVGVARGGHALHVHEHPSCVGPDFASAGGHFNPGVRHHGLDNPAGPHAGDLPNVDVLADGTAHKMVLQTGLTLAARGPTSLVAGGGRSLVLHALPDDGRSDPAGASGRRLACGVLSVTQRPSP